MKNPNDHYFRLGVFVLAGIGLAIALTIIFGSGRFFKKTMTVETYLQGSVTGLDVGASARYRGVRVGKVSQIFLSNEVYEKSVPIRDRKSYVVVRIEIDNADGSEEELHKLDELISRNLRAQMKSNGITNVNYIEFNDSDSEKVESFPPLAYDWTPKYPVIPSLPSQADMLISAIQKAISVVDNLDVSNSKDKVDKLVSNLNTAIEGDGKSNPGLSKTLGDLNTLITSLNQRTNNPELTKALDQTVVTLTSLGKTLNGVQGDTQLTMEQLKQTSNQLNDLTRRLNRNPSSIVLSKPPAKMNLQDAGEK